jgi:hypothetical protein
MSGKFSELTSAFDKPPTLALSSHGEEGGASKLDDRVEIMIQWAHRELGQEEFGQALTEFQSLGGKVFYDDAIYDARTNYFLDFFLFERPTRLQKRVLQPPFYHFLASDYFIQNFNAATKQSFLDLRFFHHSIFRIHRLAKFQLQLVSLLNQNCYDISSNDNFDWRQGFSRDCLVQGFVYPRANQFTLSSGIVLHPADATQRIARFLRRQRSGGSAIHLKQLMLLSRIQLEALRLRNRPAKAIYDARLEAASV